MYPSREMQLGLTRRHFFGLTSSGIGVAALASLLGRDLCGAEAGTQLPHFTPKARRIIYLFQSGAPSQMDLFDYKPDMRKLQGTELPDSIRRSPAIFPPEGVLDRMLSWPERQRLVQLDKHDRYVMQRMRG